MGYALIMRFITKQGESMAILNLNKKYQNLKKSYNNLGYKGTISRLIYKRYGDDFVLDINLNEKRRFSFERKLDVQIVDKQSSDVLRELYKQLNFEKHYVMLIERCFRNNLKCFIARLEGNIIGYFFSGDNKASFDGIDRRNIFARSKIELKDDELYFPWIFIAPEYRGGNNSIEFTDKVLLELNKLGYNRAIVISSFPFVTKMGFKVFRKVSSRRFLFFKFYSISDVK